MSVKNDLKKLSSAEEFFDYLGVAYDPAVVNVARLHILKRLNTLLKAEPDANVDESDEDVRTRYRAHLEQAYEELTQKGPMDQRLFKVHQDAVKPRDPAGPTAFVPLSSIMPESDKNSGESH